MAIDIVKLANGNVALYDSTSGDFLRGISPDIVEIECNEQGIVKVIQDNGNVEYFDPAEVANTEVVPAAAIPFAGDCAALATLLSTDFFFVSGGATDAASITYDNSVSGLTATNVQDAIDEVVTMLPTLQPTKNNYNSFASTNVSAVASFAIGFTDELYAVPIEIHADVTINAARIFVQTPAVGKMVIGIYDNSNGGFPGNKLVQTPEFDTNVGSFQSQSFANYVLKRGTYWVAYNANSAPSLYCFDPSNFANVLPMDSVGRRLNAIRNTGVPYNATMPATFGTYDLIDEYTFFPTIEFNVIP